MGRFDGIAPIVVMSGQGFHSLWVDEMAKPKFKYQIGRETPLGQHVTETGSWPEFKDLAGELLDSLGDETDEQDTTIIVRKVRNEEK